MAKARAIYSASQDDKATVDYFLDFQEMGGPVVQAKAIPTGTSSIR